MRTLDYATLLAAAAAMLLALQMEASVGYTHVWFHPLDASSTENGLYPLASERAGPIITDLDGDKGPEVIVATREPKLRILQITVHGSGGSMKEEEAREAGTTATTATTAKTTDTDRDHVRRDREGRGAIDLVSRVDPNWGRVALIREVDILPNLRMKTGRYPVAMQTGYIDKYRDDKDRTQVIVVVTDSCRVLCYSNKLTLIWQARFECSLAEMRVADVSIMISSHSIMETDTGMVVIGARLYPKGKASRRRRLHKSMDSFDFDDDDDDDVDDDVDDDEGESDADSDSNDDDDDADALIGKGREAFVRAQKEGGGSYSVYCFDGLSGGERWTTTTSDFNPQIDPEFDLSPLTSIESQRSSEHGKGELGWQTFRSSFMQRLPHLWFGSDDSRLDLAHFNKRRSGKSVAKKQRKRRKEADRKLVHQLPGSEVPHLPDLVRPHLEQEHIKHPNMILSHLKDGMHAIHLYTGRPVASITLKSYALHADVNADGVLDHIEAIGGWVTPWFNNEFAQKTTSHMHQHLPKSLPRCLVLVTTGIPPTSRLLNATICPKKRHSRPRAGSFDYRFTESEMGYVTVANPSVVKRFSNKRKSKRGAFELDMIFAINTGHVTSVGPKGKQNWQVHTQSGWSNLYSQTHKSHGSGLADSEVIHAGFVPSTSRLFTLANEPNSPENILVVGETVLTVLSPGGSVRATADIPAVPIARPIFGDFSGDGYTDIIIWTSDGLHGYVLRRRRATQLFVLLIGAAVVALGVALAFSAVNSSLDDER
mmetsp:Transcript_20779/g.36996  ORF Transcript_20779/g.36996 Transcript_20779/m.36996 type:complete len:767 (+) Transcript_20779:56-2356(+)|eukprot:CAMPEP_0197531844 /NCGR_PEP_ID=MMETSP1318-20131121/37381_1 /TAXON_ID=552666 /ORGANISM="Partenskyella glossopodia, Strain RCC365" /LENGTH=766 /DNA_ID=CAMNT_0043088201 /DNA_START=31 /DNA_END=2331 /DNA_ORIENTATION=-